MSEEFVREADRFLMQTYDRYPLLIVRGEGIRVWDHTGREYLDFFSGIAVSNLGHCHPKVVEAIKEQAELLLHVSNLYYTLPQIELAKRICEHSFGAKVFFCNSGAEANEAAIKLARKFSKIHHGPKRYEIITMYGSFHGRTMGALTATAQEKFHRGFEPLLPGIKYCPYDDPEALAEAIDESTCAVMVEPIQGESGVRVPSETFLKEVRRICDEKGVLLILDEVQTGMGRTGRLFAYEHWGIEPDLMTLAKALGGGLPLGALVAKEEISKAFSPGDHASTFGGNPLSCRAGCVVFDELLEGGVLENCQRMGRYLMEELETLAKRYNKVKEVRGKGLMIGVELEGPWAKEVAKKAMEKGILIGTAGDKVIRLLPPLIVEKEDCAKLLSAMEEILKGL